MMCCVQRAVRGGGGHDPGQGRQGAGGRGDGQEREAGAEPGVAQEEGGGAVAELRPPAAPGPRHHQGEQSEDREEDREESVSAVPVLQLQVRARH